MPEPFTLYKSKNLNYVVLNILNFYYLRLFDFMRLNFFLTKKVNEIKKIT